MTRLREIRKQLHLSQQQMAHLLRISRRTYGIYERGERELTANMLHILETRLHLNPVQLKDETAPAPVFPASTEEEELLKRYRRLDFSGQQYIMKALVREETLSDLYRKN